MIDWAMVGANTLWILGLALGLATLSYASWDAWATHETFRQRLGKPVPQGVPGPGRVFILPGSGGYHKGHLAGRRLAGPGSFVPLADLVGAACEKIV